MVLCFLVEQKIRCRSMLKNDKEDDISKLILINIFIHFFELVTGS